MELWHAVLLGIIEGITEFFPISSTGHLILASHVFNIPKTDFLTSFEIAIQSGAIAAVIVLYWKTILSSKNILRHILFAFLPSAAIGFLFYKPIKTLLLGNVWITVIALIGGGVFFLLLERWITIHKLRSKQLSDLHPFQAVSIGIGQSISIIPGVSRSAASLFTGMLVGLSRKEAVEFSFFLAIPTILSATAYDLLKTSPTFSGQEIVLLITGTVSAFIASLLSIQWFIRYISKHTFLPFAVYRIVIGILFAIFMSV